VRGRSGTKPGSLLRHQIPIRTFASWDDLTPRFCEVDLVAHDGGNPSGEFCQTLDLTCVGAGWTEVRVLPNKAQRWVHEAFVDIQASLPFDLRGLDSDNGAEFINQLLGFCEQNGITFTGSRAYRKNDNCFVEQKNWPVVRQMVGYVRFDTAAELKRQIGRLQDRLLALRDDQARTEGGEPAARPSLQEYVLLAGGFKDIFDEATDGPLEDILR